ncbi:MAG TPA: FAD-dependent oxidoreductase, partial [Methylibium sp.]
MKRVAVVGSGISGLAAAWLLSKPGAGASVTLYEAGDYFGGHAHTVDVSLRDASGRPVTQGVDTGFLVLNERTYPSLLKLFAELGVELAPSDMSFSVQVPGPSGIGLEWSGSDLSSVFAQRRNLLRPAFWSMLAEVLRFNRLATAIAESGSDEQLAQPLGEFLDWHRFGTAFRDWYFLPMIGCIWSCPTGQMLHFPVATLIRFCHNHGLIQLRNRPQWYTVRGGARCYVEKMLAGIADARLNCPVRAVRRVGGAAAILVATDAASEVYDEVVFACHSDQALTLLGEDATAVERELLGAIRYHRNRALLHTDSRLLPQRRLAWAAWNYERPASLGREQTAVCLHYWLNRIQPLPFDQPLLVSLNPAREPREDSVLGEYDYSHPVFDLAAIAAQRRLPEIQGRRHSWFCGAWTGYGFHEDGLNSAQAIVQALRDQAQAERA